MTVWSVDKNPEAKTMVITAEFTAPVARVWQLWADPRLLERWWGPPGYPATFEQHDLRAGGTITYSMSGEDDELDRCIDWAIERGVGVDPVEGDVIAG